MAGLAIATICPQNIPLSNTEKFVGKESKKTQITNESFTIKDNFRSDKGIDYTHLRDLLKVQNWREADEATLNAMLQITMQEEDKYFDYNHIKELPYTDLYTIDTLWIKYSKGKFGFSVQKKIYLGFCKKANRVSMYYENKAWKKFGDIIGWRVNGEWIWHSEATFDISAPKGHLPIVFPRITEPFELACLIARMCGYYSSWSGSNIPEDVFYTSPYCYPLLCHSCF